jgi:ribosomal protein S17E
MENNELKFYWYPGENTDEVKFEMNKEYVLSEIKEILSKKNSNRINGFFIHFGKPFLSFLSEESKEFHRIIIKNNDEGQFLGVTEIFSYPDFKFITDFKNAYSILPDSITEASRKDSQKGTSMLNRFGVFARKNNQNK